MTFDSKRVIILGGGFNRAYINLLSTAAIAANAFVVDRGIDQLFQPRINELDFVPLTTKSKSWKKDNIFTPKPVPSTDELSPKLLALLKRAQ